MPVARRLTAKDAALTICFAALYVILSFIPILPILGLFGKTITLATIMATVIGLLLGPYLGALSTILGGIISIFFSPVFSPPSLVSGIIAASCAGMLATNKRSFCALSYLLLLLLFGFYPSVGPFWLHPLMTWFQIIGFAILVSPLQSMATRNLNSNNNAKLLFAFFVTSLTSTLAGQIAGSFTFEIISWPTLIADINAWKVIWEGLMFLYPAERILIAVVATFVGASLYKILKSANLAHVLNNAIRQETCS